VSGGSLRGRQGEFSTDLRGTARVVGLLVLATAFALVLVEALERAGPLLAVAPVLVVAFGLLVLHPRFTLTLLFGANLALESDQEAFLTQYDTFYAPLPGGIIEPTDVLLAALVAGTLLHATRSGRRPSVEPTLAIPALLLCAAIAIGLVGAYFGDPDPGALADTLRRLSYLLVLPIATFILLRTRREIMLALAFAGALVAYKAATGLLGYLVDAGRSLEGDVLTYYSPAPNFALLAFILTAVGAALARVRLPTWVFLFAPLAAAALILSFRRNFYLALIVGIVLMVLILAGRRGRALVVPAAATLLVALGLGLTALAGSTSSSPIVERVQSLSPTRIEANAHDRYRLDELRNVGAEIARHPIAGIGLGVPWSARYPLAVVFPGGRDYVHGTVLWFWLKLGIVGVLAYLAIMLAGIRFGFRVWRDNHDEAMGMAGLALAMSFIGLMIAETTGAFVGVSSRPTVLVAVAIGWLAAADRLAGERQAGLR
jgi:putative inorganic carbon (hco3(-)) transporter